MTKFEFFKQAEAMSHSAEVIELGRAINAGDGARISAALNLEGGYAEQADRGEQAARRAIAAAARTGDPSPVVVTMLAAFSGTAAFFDGFSEVLARAAAGLPPLPANSNHAA